MEKKVTFVGAFVDFWKRFVDFNGVSSRKEFWFWVLWNFIITSVFSILMNSGTSVDPATFDVVRGPTYQIGSILNSVWGLATLIPGLAIDVRRLRDAGYSWKKLFWILLPVVGWIILIVLFCKPSVEQPVEGSQTL